MGAYRYCVKCGAGQGAPTLTDLIVDAVICTKCGNEEPTGYTSLRRIDIDTALDDLKQTICDDVMREVRRELNDKLHPL